MRIKAYFRRLTPVIALALGAAVGACDGNVKMNMGDSDGVPLAELDMSGEAPTGLAIAGPDLVRITEGDTLAITVEGDSDATDTLRFSLEGGKLAIYREDGWSDGGEATVNVTMPAPSEIAIGASGSVETPSMAADASIAIGGSGSVEIASLDADDLQIAIGGSGKVTAAGRADNLELSIGGSGDLVAPDLMVKTADINVGGSGNAEFSSDGTVEASIAGAGDIVVHGSAKCELSSFGSGSLKCQPRSNAPQPAPAPEPAQAAGAPDAPDMPSAPDAPEPPAAPDAG